MKRLSLACPLLVVACSPAPPAQQRAEPAGVHASPAPQAADRAPSPPSGWSAKLADPESRAATIRELRRLYEDALTAAHVQRDAPEVRALVDRIVEPLTRAYVQYDAELDTKTRVDLIQLLADFRDPRTEPAVRKALEEFAKKPTAGRDHTDIKWAARAAGQLKLASLGDALLRAFLSLRPSTELGLVAYRDVNAAMVAMPQQSWVAPLLAALRQEVVRPMKAQHTAAIDAYRDQLFWQTTAAQVLGELRAAQAVEPLIQVMLDPSKLDIQATAVLALVKLGKPAVARATELLKEERSQASAAIILGTIGRAEAVPPLIDAAKTAKLHDRVVDDELRAAVAG